MVRRNILNEFLSLDIGHAMDTSNTVTIVQLVRIIIYRIYMAVMYDFVTIMLVWLVRDYGVPNGEDTTSFSKAGFFLNTTNFPFEGRGYFGRGSLGLSSVCPDL